MSREKSYFTTQDVASECGLNRSLVGRYFRTIHSNRASFTWTRLTEEQFRAAVNELRACAQVCPKQPLHGLTKLRASQIEKN